VTAVILLILKLCSQRKTVIVKIGENSARYTWYYPDGKSGATGKLSRD
jgi:hypothetical protein